MKTTKWWMFAVLSALVLALAGCGDEEDTESREVPEGASIIVLGDSIMEWNLDQGASIPDVIGDTLGREVFNAAVSGATMRGGDDAIPGQYEPGAWDWVVFDGGGNDVNDACGCGDCDAVMDEILTADGQSGIARDLASRALGDGARVMVVGYMDVPPDAEFGFDRCGSWLSEQNARWQVLADSDPDIFFVSAADVVQADDTELYDVDRVHPSVEGSRVVGEYVADAILAAEGN